MKTMKRSVFKGYQNWKGMTFYSAPKVQTKDNYYFFFTKIKNKFNLILSKCAKNDYEILLSRDVESSSPSC